MEAKAVIIDPEFQALIPPLTAEEHAWIEQSIVAEGCREPLIIWADQRILIDGHHRYQICQQHQLPFQIIEKSFASREAVIIWMIQNQKRKPSP